MHSHDIVQWRIKDFASTADATNGLRKQPADDWIDGTAPGDTHAALIAAGRLPDPFRGRHEHDATWVPARTWCWRSEFHCAPSDPGECVELVFEGLDTVADLYLNGELLGRTDNMFRCYRFEIGGRLSASGSNVLGVVFAPAEANLEPRDLGGWGRVFPRLMSMKRNLIRKAQFGWGWDWGPNLPTVGIWKAVRVERWHTARIDAIRFATLTLDDSWAEASVALEITPDSAHPDLRAELVLLAPDGSLTASSTMALAQTREARLTVASPLRWWTADLGAQPLYELVVELFDGPVRIDRARRRVGLRTLTLDTSADADEPGTRFFRFVLNDVPIFARGANWIPASSFVGVLNDSHYRELLQAALRANMNMMRVWGGGVYEHDAFYDLCDELGLLVWQDFMFACAPYPEDDAGFVHSVRMEVRDQIRRLRHHPSLAMWCGNNECQMIQFMVDKLRGDAEPLPGALYYDRLLADELAELDPHTPYWPGSPAGGPSPNSMRAGDVHDWTVWHGLPPVPEDDFVGGIDRSPAGVAFTRYAENHGRFISEFGIHAAPAFETLQRWLTPEDLHLESDGFLDRIKDEPKDKIAAMMAPLTGIPRTLPQYVDFTMHTQAEGVQFGIEHFRRRKPHCAGTLIWQYNDCWPCVSWSLLDYDGVGKAAYYAVARAYAPVLASFRRLDDGSIELWITNDRLRALAGTAELSLQHLAGACEWTRQVRFEIPANGSAVVWRGEAPIGATDRILCVHSPNELFPANRHLLAVTRDLMLVADARPRVTMTQLDAQRIRVRLEADAYLLFVKLTAARPGLQFSDNYFDLRPGEMREILVSAPQTTLSPAELSVSCWNARHANSGTS